MIKITLQDPIQARTDVISEYWSYNATAPGRHFTFKDDIVAVSNIAIALGNIHEKSMILQLIKSDRNWFENKKHVSKLIILIFNLFHIVYAKINATCDPFEPFDLSK